ncbi:hypothetical protein ACLOJK_031324 [Asimina triloba]
MTRVAGMASGTQNGHLTIEGGEKMAWCEVVADGEDINDEDLFEIDLEMLNEIPPPTHAEAHPNAAGITLLANCLLPAVDVSGAVPITSDLETALEALWGRRGMDALPLVWGFHLDERPHVKGNDECQVQRKCQEVKFAALVVKSESLSFHVLCFSWLELQNFHVAACLMSQHACSWGLMNWVLRHECVT